MVGVTVDHALQEGSAEHAARVVEQMATMGVDETAAVRVQVEAAGRGPEAAAREARYAVLDEMADHFGSELVLLGHTRDDQAETVLLGLTRGSGGRSLAGMRRTFDRYRRPLLDVSRDDTVTACQVEGIDFWADPHNGDPAYTRVRARDRVLPVLEEELGPGVTEALARTADQLRDDMDLLDGLAERDLRRSPGRRVGLDVQALVDRPARGRHPRAAAGGAATPAPSARSSSTSTSRLDAPAAGAATDCQIQLPGHVTAYRDGDHLLFRPTAVES